MKLMITALMILSLPACVTTRAELNEKRNAPQAEVPVEPAPIANQYGIEEMRSELAKLTGKVEEMEQEKKLQADAHAEEQKKYQAKIEELEKLLKEKEEALAGPKLPEGKTSFEAGKDAYFNQQYADAIYFLDWFLKNNEQGKNAEEATFIRAESYFKMKEFKKAIVDYSRFPEKFPKSSFHSKSLLRIGESFDELGMKEDAKAFYQELLEKFPKTVEGKLAKKKLGSKPAKR